ncbi:MAG: dihydroorotate dehydrogenase electron transfer subunit [Thermodesulfovibrionales bacterium]
MSRLFNAEVINNLPLNSRYNLLTVKPLEEVIQPYPGQFYMLKVSNSLDPLLLRPFSFFRKTPEGIQFLFEIRGKGTLVMKQFKNGDVIHLIGPLGNGYPDMEDNKIPVLIAGGIGIASIYSLVEKFGKNSILFYGALNRESLLMLDELKRLVNELIISTDDGSVGKKGTVIDAFNDFISYNPSLITHYQIYACGRKQMLEVLTGIALKNGIKGYISVEENMACGLGACLGCAVRVKSKESGAKSRRQRIEDFNSELVYKMVCKDGPVFPLEEIVW